eukprot:Tbor_TRINITY_DN5324_c2_g3::TRINITY_DN5324_c2_g3_i1::g.3926::m.3926/K04739/PRKAR; cAMP-dependent protein kinase regulator
MSICERYTTACIQHGVKRPNKTLLKYFQGIQDDAEVEDIDLSNNYVGNRGIIALLEVVKTLPNFRYLNISNQKLYNTDLSDDTIKGNATVDKVVEVLKSHPSVNSLDVSENPISNYAGRRLLGLVQVNHNICRVNMKNSRVDFDLRNRINMQCEKNTTAIWESEKHEDDEDKGFGEKHGWTARPTTADLTSLGAGRHRRITIHTEGIDVEKVKNFIPPKFPKSDAENNLILKLLSHNVLFCFLLTEDLHRVADAMLRKEFVKSDEIMKQGSINNILYIIQEGQADILKEGQKVFLKTEGTAVGELELMYDQPCVATVKVITEKMVTWSLDRDTYRYLVMGAAIKRRNIFMKHIESIPFLSGLDNYERLQVADALSSDEYGPGDHIIRYGKEGEWMFIILEGTVEVIGRDESGHKHVCEFSEGDHFGELEFLNNHPTVADVVAKTQVVTAKLNRRHFEMCMGTMIDVLKRNAFHPKYEYYRNLLKNDDASETVE